MYIPNPSRLNVPILSTAGDPFGPPAVLFMERRLNVSFEETPKELAKTGEGYPKDLAGVETEVGEGPSVAAEEAGE